MPDLDSDPENNQTELNTILIYARANAVLTCC
jgi:hypothetical protein